MLSTDFLGEPTRRLLRVLRAFPHVNPRKTSSFCPANGSLAPQKQRRGGGRIRRDESRCQSRWVPVGRVASPHARLSNAPLSHLPALCPDDRVALEVCREKEKRLHPRRSK